MTGKGFLHSTAALLTGVGTLLAALVAVAALLVGQGVLFSKGDNGDDGSAGNAAAEKGKPKLGNSVEHETKLGRMGTEGIELDSDKGIVRNPDGDADIVIFDASGLIGSYRGAIIEWKGDKQPTHQECSDLLDTHGFTGTYDIESGRRFCVRSSGGRTAFLAIISDGNEYQVSVWKKA